MFDPLFTEILTRIGIKPPDDQVALLDALRLQRADGSDQVDDAA